MKKKDKIEHIIVTGATGFIGQNLIPLLIKKKFKVIAIGRNINKAKKFNWFSKVKFIKLDYHKQKINFDLTKKTGLIHLGWQGLPNYNSDFHLKQNLPKNYEFIKKLINKGIYKIFIAGTCFEYGLRNGGIPPNAKPEPIIPYAIAKNNLRKKLIYLNKSKKFKLQWARFFYLYGIGQNPKSLMASLDYSIKKKLKKFNLSQGNQLRDYLNVKIAVEKIIKIFESKKKGVFNICSEKPIKVKDLVNNRIRVKKSKIKVNYGFYPYSKYEPMEFCGIDSFNER